jgi:hypothetical protein
VGTNITVTSGRDLGNRFLFKSVQGDTIGIYDAVLQNQLFVGRSAYILRLSWAINSGIPIEYQNSYWIKISSMLKDSTWTEWGDSCLIITPHANLTLLPEYHGTVRGLGSNLISTVNCGLGHKYEILTLSDIYVAEYDGYTSSLNSPLRSPYIFRFNFVSQNLITSRTWYKIRISYFNGKVWSSYGNHIIIRTP